MSFQDDIIALVRKGASVEDLKAAAVEVFGTDDHFPAALLIRKSADRNSKNALTRWVNKNTKGSEEITPATKPKDIPIYLGKRDIKDLDVTRMGLIMFREYGKVSHDLFKELGILIGKLIDNKDPKIIKTIINDKKVESMVEWAVKNGYIKLENPPEEGMDYNKSEDIRNESVQMNALREACKKGKKKKKMKESLSDHEFWNGEAEMSMDAPMDAPLDMPMDDYSEYDDLMAQELQEVEMAKAQLYKISKYAIKLHEMLKGTAKLQPWMETKIAQVSDDIGDVYHSMDYDTKSEKLHALSLALESKQRSKKKSKLTETVEPKLPIPDHVKEFLELEADMNVLDLSNARALEDPQNPDVWLVSATAHYLEGPEPIKLIVYMPGTLNGGDTGDFAEVDAPM